MSNGSLFGRRCRLVLGTGGSSGIDVTDLRWTFEIEKTMTEDPNKSIITVYNLDNYENQLKEGMPIILEAGYEGSQYGTIFTGVIRQPLIGADNNVDHYVRLIGLDSAEFMNKSSINSTIAKGASFSDVVNKCVSDSTKTIETGLVAPELSGGTQLSRGKVLFGQPKKYMNQISNTNDMIFYTNDGEVNIVKPTDIPNNQAIELNPNSGLIGRPTQNEEGVTGTSLLNPSMNINTLVHIDKSYIQQAESTDKSKPLPGSGIYKVIKITHKGDNQGNDWYTEFEAIAQPNSSVISAAQK